MNNLNITLYLPTYNAEIYLSSWIKAYEQQTVKVNHIVIIDSSSQDNTTYLVKQAGFSFYSIEKKAFNHGGTRNQAVILSKQFVKPDIVIFMTQDAILASPHSLEELLRPFVDPQVAAVCGRQLPHKNANPLATHARLFNYPDQSMIKSKENIPELGIKCAFMSNSFAAYRYSIFEELGGFPNNTILAEDMYLAAKMILANYKIAYCAEATVYHSHNYSLWEEFKRYFDTGVFQQKEAWIQEKFGKANSEGKKFVLSEIKYLLSHHPLWIFKAIFSTFFKFTGFKLGLNWYRLPNRIRYYFSMHKNYWLKENEKNL